MKKTLTVNLGGTVFNIDEDAYRLLDNYLCNLKLHFKKLEGADEIVDDIERRISELFAEKLTDGLQVITIADVEEVIARMGKPEEMEEDGMENEASYSAKENAAPHVEASENQEHRKIPRRFYRNPDDKMLGGVAGGIAAYFGWDVTVVRLTFIILLLCGAQFMLPVYLICWIVVPEAKTAAERLSMRGEEVTVENIGKTVTDGFDKAEKGGRERSEVRNSSVRSSLGEIGSMIVTVIGWILKIGLVMLAVFCSPLLFVAAIVLLILLFVAVVVLFAGAEAFFSLFPMAYFTLPDAPMTAIVMYIALTLLLGIPLLGIVYSIFRPLFKWQSMPFGLKFTLVLLWLISTVTFFITFTMYGAEFPELLIRTHYV
ncbi:phage shock protein C, PspC [gut metagenome]|uniref:Phage shock protein C, PspC n=1 Tax=gut metagenome TaxID=749906 RepID=J9GNP9_9ZZZZ